MKGRFLVPCTQVQGRGSCPQGHGPHNQVHLVRSYRQRHVRYTLVRTTTTTTTTHLSHECHPGANPKQQRMQQPNEARGSQ